MTKRMIGPFEVGDRIGVGGMGIVYRATYTKNGARVALKILSPDVSDSESLQRRFEREISILKKLQHPNIVRYYGGGKFGSQRFYAMELVEAGSVESYLKKKQRLPWEEALDIATQIAMALEHAHEAGVIHRDLKPANLLMSPGNVIKLTDFGIARDTTATALTAAGKTVGTYAYMAPEQIRGKPPVDKKTDLYALGCVLFEMIAGETPFTSENQGEMLMQHLQEDPPRITSLVPDCPLFLEELIFRLLEKDPADRVYDALALQGEIENVRTKVTEQRSMAAQTLATGTVGGRSQSAEELKSILGKKKKKKKKDNSPFYERIWFLALCLLLLLGVVAWQFMPPGEEQLMARADKLLLTEYTADWREAKTKYLQPLIERFPEGRYAEKAHQMMVDIDKKVLDKDMHSPRRLREGPANEQEKLFLAAEHFLKFGDRITALRQFRSITRLFKDKKDAQLYVLLAEDQINAIVKAGGADEDYISYINKKLKEADSLFKKGNTVDAEEIWTSVKNLYRDNEEVRPQVAYAVKRIERSDNPGNPPWLEPLEPADNSSNPQ
ncbi:serine/threonine protein kinase [Schlesneria paludicola]|uniref:serine/threonine protein kinase n=1 Tax=Schlesneria paludicola TaxID=360056 RepID=UPI00029A890A|nr:serine/threonine-protein kinase [Schlesneria paludicola]